MFIPKLGKKLMQILPIYFLTIVVPTTLFLGSFLWKYTELLFDYKIFSESNKAINLNFPTYLDTKFIKEVAKQLIRLKTKFVN